MNSAAGAAATATILFAIVAATLALAPLVLEEHQRIAFEAEVRKQQHQQENHQ